MTYPNTRRGAIRALLELSDLPEEDFQNARAEPSPTEDGCWAVSPGFGESRGRWFIVFVGDHPEAPGWVGGQLW